MITGALVEQNVLKLAITFGVVAYGGSVLEPKFGTKQLAMYLGAVTLVSSVVISLAVIFGYMITFRESLLYVCTRPTCVAALTGCRRSVCQQVGGYLWRSGVVHLFRYRAAPRFTGVIRADHRASAA